MMPLPKVAIILLNWKCQEDTLECLESVFRLNYPDFKVVLCDNDSRDGSLEAFEEWARGKVKAGPASDRYLRLFERNRTPGQVRHVSLTRHQAETPDSPHDDASLVLIDTGGNLGFAGGNNVGIRYAMRHTDADYFWLLNTDTVVEPDALGALIDRASADDRPGMVGSSLIYYWSPDTVQAMGGASMDVASTHMRHINEGASIDSIPADGKAVEAETAYVVGASMLVARPFIERIGLMCEEYFLYYEEVDWAMRAKGLFRLGYAPGSRVYHKVGGASRRKASTAAMRYMMRNRIKFVARYLPASLRGTLLNMATEMLKALLKGRLGTFQVAAGALLNFRRLREEGLRMSHPPL